MKNKDINKKNLPVPAPSVFHKSGLFILVAYPYI